MITVRKATDEDFRAVYGREPPAIWTGLVVERGGAIIASGEVLWNEWGKAEGYIHKLADVPPVTVQRATLRVLQALRAVGEPDIHVGCDMGVPNAARWLERLGFAPTEHDPHIWRKELSA